jgi:hypothetical protein
MGTVPRAQFGGSQLQQPARVIADPELPEGLLSAELEEFERKQRPMFDE